MKGIIFGLALALVVPHVAEAQGVSRQFVAREEVICPVYRGGALSAGAIIGGIKLGTNAVRVTSFGYHINTAAGTATATMTFRISDGTNNCDAVVDCTTTDVRAAGVKLAAVSGTCIFAAGSVLTVTVQAQCGTAQPSMSLGQVNGFRL